MPAHAAVITHKVADFDKWLTAFNAHQGARKDAGVLTHQVSRGADDPKLVRVYLTLDDTDKFKAFITNGDTKQTMADAGVQGQPEVTMVKPVDLNPVTDRSVPAAAIFKNVEDFDRWKASFDSFSEGRAKAGVIGHAVNQGVENPNTVLMMLQMETRDGLNAFFANPKLEEVNKAAGVIGDPAVTMVEAMETVTY